MPFPQMGPKTVLSSFVNLKKYTKYIQNHCSLQYKTYKINTELSKNTEMIKNKRSIWEIIDVYCFKSICAGYLRRTYCWEGWRARMLWHHYGSKRKGRQQTKGRVGGETQSKHKSHNNIWRKTPDLTQKTYVLFLEYINTKPGGRNKSRQAEQIKWAATLHTATYSSTLSPVNQTFTV